MPKKLSGYQNRIRKAARDQASQLDIAGKWMSLATNDGGLGKVYTGGKSNGKAIELPIYGQPPATLVSAVSAALLQLEQGNFYSSAYLCDGMLRDDRVAAVLGVRIGGLIGSQLDLVPAKDTGKGRSVKEDAEELLTQMVPLHQVSELLRYGIMLSVGIGQVLSTRTKSGRTPSFRVWNPRHLRFDWLSRQYRLVTENKGEITIERDDPEWILYEPYGPYGWLHGAAMRALAAPWLMRYWTRNWWARHNEILGSPLRLGIIPAERSPADEKLFLSQLSNLAHEAVIRLPQGEEGNKFDVKLLEAQSNSWKGFSEFIAHCDDSIAIYLLGQQQSTKGQGGLGAQENPGDAVRMDIKRLDSLISCTLRDQILKPWANDNYGDAELAPYIQWQVDPPEDQEKRAAQFDKLADAVSKFATAPDFARHVDIRALLESFDVPLRPEDDVPPDVPNSPEPLPVDDDGKPIQVAMPVRADLPGKPGIDKPMAAPETDDPINGQKKGDDK